MSRRGLTLVEVLVATALLTLIAVAVVPVVRAAAEVHRADHVPHARIHALSLVADAYLEEHAAALADRTLDELRTGLPPASPSDGEPVEVALLAADDPEADHAWLVFTLGDATVLRWTPLAVEVADGGRPR